MRTEAPSRRRLSPRIDDKHRTLFEDDGGIEPYHIAPRPLTVLVYLRPPIPLSDPFAVSQDNGRVNFEFNACKLKYKGLVLPLPPVGKVKTKRRESSIRPLNVRRESCAGWSYS